jgi:hypothetical protein
MPPEDGPEAPKHVVDTNRKIKTFETNTVANVGTPILKIFFV